MIKWLLVPALLVATAPADACRCAQRNLAEYFDAASEVATARLHSVTGMEERRLMLQFELLAPPYKTQRSLSAGDRLSYQTAASSAACGIAPEKDAVYVLFARQTGDETTMLQIDTCSGTRVLLPTDGQAREGFKDVPARFIPQQLNALAGLSVLKSIAAAQPDASDANNETLVGLLDVAGFSHAGHALLLARPDPDAERQAEVDDYGGLATREVGYETPSAVVYARVGGWYKLRTSNGDYGWLPPEYAGTFFPYDELPVRRLAYLPLPWHGFVWPSPGAGLPVRVLPPDGQREQPAEILESTSIGGSLWFRVNLLEASPCEGGQGGKGTTGWIPGYREDGTPVAWYYSRGC